MNTENLLQKKNGFVQLFCVGWFMVMKIKFKQWWSSIPPTSTQWTITFHLNWKKAHDMWHCSFCWYWCNCWLSLLKNFPFQSNIMYNWKKHYVYFSRNQIKFRFFRFFFIWMKLASTTWKHWALRSYCQL